MTQVEPKAPGRTRIGRDLWILTFCQFLYYGGTSVDLTLTAVVGLHLAPTPALATAPLTAMTTVAVIASYGTGVLAARFGHRQVLAVGAFLAVVGGLVSVYATITGSFWVLCAGTAIVGLYKATGGYFRYLATDLAPEHQRERALSIVLTGGVLAAIIGPLAATWASDLFRAEFAGSYLLVAILGAVTVPLVMAVRSPARRRAATAVAAAATTAAAVVQVRVRDVVRTSNFVVAFALLAVSGGVMTLLMAVGPIGSEHAGHTLGEGAMVIQWHLIGMFAPSLISGKLVSRWGADRTGLIGAAVLLAGAVVGASGLGLTAFTVSLGLVGVGWNLLYVAGTAFVIRTYPAGGGGRVQGVMEATTAVVSGAASFSASPIFLSLGWQGTNVAAGLFPLVLVIAMVFVYRNGRRQKALEPQLG
ncbi:MFS transporter [Amycolatopsis sp. NPDC005232]|uniref:MFS transporter n=1 Tax=Amycolatopsis sp. NPDC005232 TaxID=3157027 RepID=UPI0033AB8007